MILSGYLYVITLPFMFTNVDVNPWVGCPSVNEIYFYSCFTIYWIAGTPTEITQPTEETEWDLDYRVSDNAKSLVKGMLFLLFVLLLEKYSCELVFFSNCIGRRNYKDFQSKITVCVLNKANPGQSGLQRYLVCYIWSWLVFFQVHRKMFFSYLIKTIQIFQFWLLFNYTMG